MSLVDVVVVSYNSREQLHGCVEPLVGVGDIRVAVVDNASTDRSLEAVEGLSITTLPMPRNGGFAYGCNAGWRIGEAPFVLFLNPDARIDEVSVRRLARVLEDDDRLGAVGPKIVEPDGRLAFSQRRFPRLRSTYATAFFLHRLFPGAAWADEIVRSEDAYGRPGSPEWISGACILVRRRLLEELGGFDERFFLYCEDKDLCRRIRTVGYDIRYEPSAVCRHDGGASAPRTMLISVAAESRARYADKHRGPVGAWLERLGIALRGLTHAFVTRGGLRSRAEHARSSLRVLLRRDRRIGPAQAVTSRLDRGYV
jgi:N-acetylglucosaminyl-diphospho-decaprenol L-rhamnosyltransferase